MARLNAIGFLLAGLAPAGSAFAEYHPGDNPQIVDGKFPCEFFESCTGFLSEEQLERSIYFADCISFAEFQNGWYSLENGLAFAERKRERRQNPIFQYTINYVFDNNPPTDSQLSELNWIVDSSGNAYETEYLSGGFGEAPLVRSEVFITDHCNY